MTSQRPTKIPAYDLGALAREAEPVEIDLEAIPAWRVAPSDLPTLAMKEAFVLIHVDGVATINTIVDLARLGRAEGVAMIASLVAEGVIELRPRRGASTAPSSEVRPRVPLEQNWALSVEDPRSR